MAQENLRSDYGPNLLNIPIKNILPPSFFICSRYVIDAYHRFIIPVFYRFPGCFGMFLLVFVAFSSHISPVHVLCFRFFVKNSASQIFSQNALIQSDCRILFNEHYSFFCNKIFINER